MQVAEAMHKYGQKLKITVAPIYGGHSFGQQVQMLKRGVDIVVATPGLRGRSHWPPDARSERNFHSRAR